jgi:hypothetical protein
VLTVPNRSPARPLSPVRPVGPPERDSIRHLQVAVRRLVSLRPRRLRLTATVCVALTDVTRRTGQPLVPAGPRTSGDDAVAVMAYQLGPALIDQPVCRFDPLARDIIADVLHGWVTDPHRYVPVAPYLAAALAAPVTLAGGWTAVTDRPLQTGRHAPLLAWYLTSATETL